MAKSKPYSTPKSGRLTLTRCDDFQLVYGRRHNKGNSKDCQREVLAMLEHYTADGDHTNCPERWCGKDRAPTEKPLPPSVVQEIEPIFKVQIT